jgi:ubiquinone/menaquinone biosynthesis C-methylase UbiE
MVKHIEGFAAEIDSSSLMLDIGSGDVPYKHIFYTQKYIAVDLSTRHKIDAVGDICALPFQASMVDVVLCTEVIEHVKNTDKALKEVNRVLRDGGHMVLTAPLLVGVHDTADYCRFTETMLRILLERHGFEILQMEKRGGILSVLGAILLQIPLQVLGYYREGSFSKYKYFLVVLLYVFLVPLAQSLVVLDVLDKAKDFTLGYDCLCKKSIVKS